MSCLLCASGNHGEFASEIVIHFRGLKNLAKPPFGYSRSYWSAWIAAFRSLLSCKPNWRCLLEVLRQPNSQLEWVVVRWSDDQCCNIAAMSLIDLWRAFERKWPPLIIGISPYLSTTKPCQ